jgi:hypothetical protein
VALHTLGNLADGRWQPQSELMAESEQRLALKASFQLCRRPHVRETGDYQGYRQPLLLFALHLSSATPIQGSSVGRKLIV